MTATATLATITKVRNLMRETNLTLTRLSALLETYGLTGVSDTNLSRALQRGKFPSQQMDDQVRSVVLRMEKLVAFLKPFKPSFEDAEVAHTMLEILDGCNISFQIEPKVEAETSASLSTKQ